MEFISSPLEPGQVPDPWTVVEEIDMVFFTQINAMYYLLSDTETIDSEALVEGLLFVLRGQWKNWQNDFFKHVRKIESANERKQRAWIEKHKDFIIQLTDLEDNGADVVALFHEIIKKQGAEKADNGRSHVTE